MYTGHNQIISIRGREPDVGSTHTVSPRINTRVIQILEQIVGALFKGGIKGELTNFYRAKVLNTFIGKNIYTYFVISLKKL